MKAIILAGGKGKRLNSEKSDLPKAMRMVLGKPMLGYVLENLDFIADEDINIVVGYKREKITEFFKDKYKYAYQAEQLGTGHAALMCKDEFADYDGPVLITAGDMPLLSKDTYKKLCNTHIEKGAACTMLTTVIENPPAFGRVLRDENGKFDRIVEFKDCTPEQQKINELNTSVYIFDSKLLFEYLPKVENKNKQGEYYLTDVPAILKQNGYDIEIQTTYDADETIGVNNIEQLKQCEEIMKARQPKITIITQKEKKQITTEKGKNLLDLLREEGFNISSPCGGAGVCGKCGIKILSPADFAINDFDKEFFTDEQLKKGYRLACKHTADTNLEIRLLEEDVDSAEIMVDTKTNVKTQIKSAIKKVTKQLDVANLEDQLSDVERIEAAFGAKVKKNIYNKAAAKLREADFLITSTIYEDTIIDIESKETQEKYGVAIDIGTTTVAMYILDLNTNKVVETFSVMNPQRVYGFDVISRIDYIKNNPDGLDLLQNIIIEGINKLLKKSKYDLEKIYHVTVVGNTVMMHIFAGLNPENIAVVPFVPIMAQKTDYYAHELNICTNKNAVISILPMVAGYVGADTIADALGIDIDKNCIIVDIGTNGEIVLSKDGVMYTCATAAGPAFEGAEIEFGMGGVAGAVSKCIIDDDVKIETILNQPAEGICGSGIVDITAQLKKAEIIDIMGRFVKPEEAKEKFNPQIAERVVMYKDKPAFLIARKSDGHKKDIYFTQRDIRQVQLAKSALASGVVLMVKESGLSFDDIDALYLAGGFGNYIDYNHACDIELIPGELRGKVIPIGNAAGQGAIHALQDSDIMDKAIALKNTAKYSELSTNLEFQTLFVDYMPFGKFYY